MEGSNETLTIVILTLAGLAVLITLIFSFRFDIANRLFRLISNVKTVVFAGRAGKKDIQSFNRMLDVAGYAYDAEQDIFYSSMNAWQRKSGYCRLYDEAAAPMGMIIDCEPIYFEYDDKRWMIAFWKGQYGMTTGCEIGVYSTEGPDLNILGVFNGTFYLSAGDEDLLQMSFTLYKNNKAVIQREGRHWWLTGFILGEFSEPSQLKMHVSVTLKDQAMCDAFIRGLSDAGYSKNELKRIGNTVNLIYKKPHTAQPYTRTKATDRIVQSRNKYLCDMYRELTKGVAVLPKKLKTVRKKAPDIYKNIMDIGKPKTLFNIYEKIKIGLQ